MKRGRENYEQRVTFESIDMTKCLMLLSQIGQEPKSKSGDLVDNNDDNVFECKTCHRRFPSFQALGGHRASHNNKKPRLNHMLEDQKLANHDSKFPSITLLAATPKPPPKMHECGICGKKFSMGQALGGHMRKHRVSVYESNFSIDDTNTYPLVSKVKVLSRSNSKRILCLDLDLNLTPLENDLQALFGKVMHGHPSKLDLRFSS